MKESVLFWPVRLEKGTLYILDETVIPDKVTYIRARKYQDAIRAVVDMKTRAFGQFLTVCYTFLLEMQKVQAASRDDQMQLLKEMAHAFNTSRPTFPFEEVTSMILGVAAKVSKSPRFYEDFMGAMQGFLEGGIRQKRYQRAQEAASLIQDGDTILTHCNVSGELPLVGEFCRKENKNVSFIATETRPYFQGSRLTAWELEREGFDVTLIPDNAVAAVMSEGKVNSVLVGSDRSAANGDFANKIGTYQIALLAKHFKIPFYCLAQPSQKLATGKDIPVEVRKDEEVLSFQGHRLAAKGAAAYYPGFDVVPHELVTRHISLDGQIG